MNEAARQFYLEQAGITLWYSRNPLSGAAPSPEFDFAEPEPAQAPGAAEPVASPMELDRNERAGRMAQLQGLVTDNKSPISPREKPVEAPVPEPSAAVPDAAETKMEAAESLAAATLESFEPIEADWGFWVGDRVVLISEFSPDASYQLQDALARNILKAVDQEAGVQFRVQWPVFSNPRVPGNGRVGFVRVISDQRACFAGKAPVLLGVVSDLGGESRKGLLSEALGENELAEAVDFEHSLAALSTNPEAKRELWQALQQKFKR